MDSASARNEYIDLGKCSGKRYPCGHPNIIVHFENGTEKRVTKKDAFEQYYDWMTDGKLKHFQEFIDHDYEFQH